MAVVDVCVVVGGGGVVVAAVVIVFLFDCLFKCQLIS